MSRNIKYTHAIRQHTILINDEISRGYQLLRTLRPDVKTKQDFMTLAWEYFLDNYVALYAREFKALTTKTKNYKYKFNFVISYQDTKLIPKLLWDAKTQFNLDKKITKAELFRKALLFYLAKYKIFDMQTGIILDEIWDYDDFIDTLDSETKSVVLEAMRSELIDDNTLIKEQQDDKTLELENADDKTIETELEDDKSLEIENDTKYENDDYLEDKQAYY